MGADSNTSCPAVEGTAPGAGNVPAFPSVSGRMANLRLALRGFVSDRIEGGPAFADSIPGSERFRGQADVTFKF